MSSPTVSLSAAFAKGSGFGPVDRLILNILDRTASRYKACLLASKTIADRIGRSVRTVQLALKRLSEAGYVAVELTRKLNSGHRIHLLWRGLWSPPATPSPDDAPDPDFGATDCAEPTPHIAPISEPPPDPPIEAPEGNTPTEPEKNPASLFSGGGDSRPQQEEPTTVKAVEKARQVLTPDPKAPGRIEWFAGRFSPEWLDRALEKAESKARQQGTPVTWDYLAGILWNWNKQGGPPERKVPPQPKAEPPRLGLAARIAARLAAQPRP